MLELLHGEHKHFEIFLATLRNLFDKFAILVQIEFKYSI